jgi:predicted nuclease of predicted toxin-antitoxin system
VKLLIDSCLPRSLASELAAEAHDAIWSGDWEEDPGDSEILKRAFAERRVLVTLDKDFGRLAVMARQARAGILRIRKTRPRQFGEIATKALILHADDLLAGAIVVASPQRIRVRRS